MARTDAQIIAELRAENEALKRVMTAMRETKRTAAALIELKTDTGNARWTVTAPWPVLERELAEAVGHHIAEQLGEAVRLTRILFTGTSVEAQGTEEIILPKGEGTP